MAREIIRTPDARCSARFSQAVKVDSPVYVSGVVGINPKTNELAGSTIQEQTRRALINCGSILRAAGATLQDVVDVLVLLARPGKFTGLNDEYAKFFPIDPPARAVVSSVSNFPTLSCRSRRRRYFESDLEGTAMAH
jgi:2-iminobutanoate/2-iminopropanoate deaminase